MKLYAKVAMILASLFCAPGSARGDGFPFEGGYITGKKSIITLSFPQAVCAHLVGAVPLTSTQIETLLEKSGKRRETLGIWRQWDAGMHEDGCTCGISNFGLLTSSTTIEVPHSLLLENEPVSRGFSFMIQIFAGFVLIAGGGALFIWRRRRRMKGSEKAQEGEA
ncbi:MAG: hypothetical protein ACYTHM_19350 [Planctomycetota bacterium]|jgi:hypothetical protein